jgi:hypothetical protein
MKKRKISFKILKGLCRYNQQFCDNSKARLLDSCTCRNCPVWKELKQDE